MTPKAAFTKWAFIGMATATILTLGQARALDGLAGMLQVGETSDLRPLIEAELGEVPLVEGPGHDGQIFYAIGLDLSGETVPELLDHGGYRYRRILGPAVASMLGLLDGEALLIAMAVLGVVSTGLAAGAVGASARLLGLTDWVALAVILNPGVWLAVRLLTPDVLALALMSLGLFAFVSRSRLSVTAFALSGLTKEAYLTTPFGLAVASRRWRLAVLPMIALAAWMTWVHLAIGDGFTGRGNLALPFTGLLTASKNWAVLAGDDLFYLIFALLSVIIALVLGATRRTWLRWSLLGWAALGIISSNWVWDFGNNAARAFAPIAVLAVLSFGRPADKVGPGQSVAATSNIAH